MLSFLLELWVIASIVMALGWAISVYRNRFELVDVLWAALTCTAGVICALSLDGNETRRIFVLVLCSLWGIRLTFHLFRDRYCAPHEDTRYLDLKNSWTKNTNFKFFIFFQLQAFLIPVLATTFYAACSNSNQLGFTDILALLVALVSIIGESTADSQLKYYKANKSKFNSSICKIGLWSYSRHPNYFFEWVYWLSYPILSIASNYFVMSLFSPILILYLVLFVTGIPPVEARMMLTRKEEFEKYIKEVPSSFIPLPKK
jgi:steroid 5-alpha reductase family enzyme